MTSSAFCQRFWRWQRNAVSREPAKLLGVSPSALSHAIRGLEERLGVRLLSRTTRSVAPTEAGEQFLARIGPALADVRGALDYVTGLRDRPAGRVRLVASRLAARMVLAPKLAQFAREYPDIVLELTTTEESRLDLVGAGFDAGITLVSSSNVTWSPCASRRNSERRLSQRRVFRGPPKAAVATRSPCASLHQLSSRVLRCLSLGVRQGTEVALSCSQRAAHRR